ncbi:DUF5954 family protein [Streptomyces sp. B-S-A8]|uniref:DUF5954 family protein n=1 Tax=Streptomyces solicavernae TaxID=3043614 RepID=A0ABT6RUX9_9ACTN|nr:DUF5954 family protein [Streptomyces sp. B-S-A8]MDI3388246.1 DUF5954 family protein [Streptomyces sp. B-S-A8]
MSGYEDSVPGYLTFRVAPQPGPIAAFADQEAWQARERYPDLKGVGIAEFFHARECETGGWELSEYSTDTPQGSRDSLGSRFRRRAKGAEDAGDAKAQKAWMAAALRMDREVVDEIRVRGERFRIVRASRFIRMGGSGPEPPRPSDPDPGEPGEAYRVTSRTKRLVVDPYTTTGLSDGLLKLDLVRFIGTLPEAGAEAREDAVRAAERYPGGVLLPAVFMVSERADGKWRALDPGGAATTPQGARDSLAGWLRVMGPFSLRLSEEERAVYAEAADRLDEKRGNSLSVDGSRYRITRVERLVRVGPDGPEGPRPSDFDPEPPVEVHAQQLKEQGLWQDEDDPDPDPPELDERGREFQALWEQEEKRRLAVRERREQEREQQRRGVSGEG